MSEEILKFMAESMEKMGLEYYFLELKGQPEYPYFVGEYLEESPAGELGEQDTQFILTGFSRSGWTGLEQAKKKIKEYFNRVTGRTIITEDKSVVAVFYEKSSPVLTGEMELKKIQIDLLVKEWSAI